MIKIALVGILGFGSVHLRSIRACEEDSLCSLDALVVADMENSRTALQELLAEKPALRVYPDLEALIHQKDPVDLVCLPTGIASHRALSEQFLKAGYNVLCEKPAAGSLEDALSMAAAQRDSGKVLAIGYQNLFSPSIQKIKAIALSGRLGALREARTIVGWPRDKGYYSRNSWAGKISVGDNFIFDSPLQNGAAHFLQNMLYVSGVFSHDCCDVHKVYGENYRVNDIPSADTQFIRVYTRGGAVLNMAASHGIEDILEPETVYIFEKGRILWNNDTGRTRVVDSEEHEIDLFDNGTVDPLIQTFKETLRSIEEGCAPASDIHNALAHAQCLDGQYRCMNPIRSIETIYTGTLRGFGTEGDDLCYIKDLRSTLQSCFKTGKSFREMNLPWSRQGKLLTVSR